MEPAKNLLVIGGTGFIGKHVVCEAARREYKTTVLSMHIAEKTQCIDGTEYLKADISDYEELKRVLIGKSFSHVVNLGGYINHASYKEGGCEVINTHFAGVQNLVQFLDWGRLKSFVQVGSSDEYGNASAPQQENTRERPISSYSLAKLAASQLLQMLQRTEGFPAVILRLFLVYGPGQNNQRFLPQIISACLRGESFATSHGKQLRDFCFIDDVVNGIFLALENVEAHGEVINLASGEPVAIKSVLEEVVKVIGSGMPRYGELPYRVGENMALYADITKAIQKLGWNPAINLEEGITRTIGYYEGEK